MTEPLIRVRGVSRAFPAGDEMVRVLKDVDLDIEAGEMMAIIGASGSGKSTLMNILGCLDRPTDGSYWIEGRETSKMSVDELAALRRERFGFIFQRYHLLGDLSAASNVEVPAIYAGRSRSDRHKRSISLLTRLGLAERTGNIPGKLSGGQQQRVSIARALMNGGEIILADEPTGALDTHSGTEVIKILRELHAEGHTIILVTHDKKIAEHADRVVEISDGVIISDERNISKSAATARPIREHAPGSGWRGAIDRMTEAFRMAGAAIWAHKMRSLLTMLGIIIGIASVAAISALGAGFAAPNPEQYQFTRHQHHRGAGRERFWRSGSGQDTDPGSRRCRSAGEPALCRQRDTNRHDERNRQARRRGRQCVSNRCRRGLLSRTGP